MLDVYCKIDGYALIINLRCTLIDTEVVFCLICYYKVSFLIETVILNTTCCIIELFLDSCFLDLPILFDVYVHHTQSY